MSQISHGTRVIALLPFLLASCTFYSLPEPGALPLGEEEALEEHREKIMEYVEELVCGGMPEVRAAAAEAIAIGGQVSMLPELVRLLDDPAAIVRATSAWCVGLTGRPEDALYVLPLLWDKSATVRVNAARTLAASGDKSLASDLVSKCSSSDPIVRGSAANALGELAAAGAVGDAEAAAGALYPLLEGADFDVRAYAAKALAQLGKLHPALDVLEAVIRDGPLSSRIAAVWAVGELRAAGLCGGPAGDETMDSLIMLALGDETPAVQAAACRAVARAFGGGKRDAVPGRIVKKLLAALGSWEVSVSVEAAKALGAVGSTSDLAVLSKVLDNAWSILKPHAARAMGQIVHGMSEEHLHAGRVVRRESTGGAGHRAAGALAERGGKEPAASPPPKHRFFGRRDGVRVPKWAYTSLRMAAASRDSRVRVAALEALVHCGSVRAAQGLASEVVSDSRAARLSAASSLGRVGSHRTVGLLLRNIESWNRDERMRAACALSAVRIIRRSLGKPVAPSAAKQPPPEETQPVPVGSTAEEEAVEGSSEERQPEGGQPVSREGSGESNE